MIDRDKIGQEIKVIICWQSDCSECLLKEYNCSNITPEEIIDIARKNKDVFLEKFYLMDCIVGGKAVRSAAFSVVTGAKMK